MSRPTSASSRSSSKLSAYSCPPDVYSPIRSISKSLNVESIDKVAEPIRGLLREEQDRYNEDIEMLRVFLIYLYRRNYIMKQQLNVKLKQNKMNHQ